MNDDKLRDAFHDWFASWADPHSGRVERNIKRTAAWAGVQFALEWERKHIPEGCTPKDAEVLRQANHALAEESVKLQTFVNEVALGAYTQEELQARARAVLAEIDKV